jgi:hypothetical protein
MRHVIAMSASKDVLEPGFVKMKLPGALARWSLGAYGVLLSISMVGACAPIRGFPADPTDSLAATDKDLVASYYAARTDQDRVQYRNQIVSGRLSGYDSAYSDFKRRLSGDNNALNIAADLSTLTLAGLATTTGNLATATALAAAATGVLGAKGAINSDLYFQRTLPALLAQMDANRARAKLPVSQGVRLSDDRYPLVSALMDLDALRDAGGVATAIGGLTQDAEIGRQSAETRLRTVQGVPNTSAAVTLRTYVLAPGLTAAERRQRIGQVEEAGVRLGFPPQDATSLLNDTTPEGLARMEAIARDLNSRLGP